MIGKYIFWAFVIAWYAFFGLKAYRQHLDELARNRKRRRFTHLRFAN